MEFASGGSLANLLTQYGKFGNEGLTESFTGQILDGLEYLHSRKVVHRVSMFIFLRRASTNIISESTIDEHLGERISSLQDIGF